MVLFIALKVAWDRHAREGRPLHNFRVCRTRGPATRTEERSCIGSWDSHRWWRHGCQRTSASTSDCSALRSWWTGRGWDNWWPGSTLPRSGDPAIRPCAAGQGAAVAAVVQPVRPAAGGSLGGPALLPPLRGAGLAGRYARSFHHQPISTVLGAERRAQLFQELAQQREAQGLILKQGTLLAGILVAAPVRRPSLAAGRGARRPRDPAADWTDTQRRRHWLQAQGIKDRILPRAHKHQRALPTGSNGAMRCSTRYARRSRRCSGR